MSDMKEFEKDQVAAIENFIEACKKLKEEGVTIVGWTDGSFDMVNERYHEWDVVNGTESNYPHHDPDFKYKDMTFPAIINGFGSDGYGIRITDKTDKA